jgi:hypothetical protein
LLHRNSCFAGGEVSTINASLFGSLVSEHEAAKNATNIKRKARRIEKSADEGRYDFPILRLAFINFNLWLP